MSKRRIYSGSRRLTSNHLSSHFYPQLSRTEPRPASHISQPSQSAVRLQHGSTVVFSPFWRAANWRFLGYTLHIFYSAQEDDSTAGLIIVILQRSQSVVRALILVLWHTQKKKVPPCQFWHFCLRRTSFWSCPGVI